MRVRGNTVGFPNPQPDWNQTNTSQGDYIKNKPAIVTTEDGYTEITGLRPAVSAKVAASGNTVTVTRTLAGNVSSVSVITLNDNGLPVTVVTDGVECELSWEGFE